MTPVRAVARRLHLAAVPAPSPDEREHLRVVDTPGRAPAPRRAMRRAPLVGLLLFVGLLALAASHALLVQGQLHLDALDEAVAEQQEAYHRARLDVARLEAPERVVNEAIIRLGMVQPDDVVYLTPEVPEVTDERSTTEVDETWRDVKPYLERSS